MNDKLNIIGSVSAITFTTISWTEMNVILSAIASGLAILISIVTLINLCVKWFKKATADGKITADEIEEGLQIVQDGMKEVKDTIESEQKKHDKE